MTNGTTVLLAATLLIAGCSPFVSGDQLERAKELCAQHGGVKRVELSNTSVTVTTCTDGVQIEAKTHKVMS